MSSNPIAVLDSGAGGLSVVKALSVKLPCENIHYFADTAHLPYGIKSPELIKRLALDMVESINRLNDYKALVIACHTMSVWCLGAIEHACNIPVIGMVEPSLSGLIGLMGKTSLSRVGILSTKATVDSKVYQELFRRDPLNKIRLIEQAASPLVSLVEDSELSLQEQLHVLTYFLNPAIRQGDALMIGCTHFSALSPLLAQLVDPRCRIVDGADFAAEAVALTLRNGGMLAPETGSGRLTTYVTDNVDRFKKVARRFIDKELSVRLLGQHETM